MVQGSSWLTAGPRLWDAAGVLLVLGTTWLALDGVDASAHHVGAWIVGLVCAASVLLRRRAPVALLGVALVSVPVFEMLAGDSGGPAFAVAIGVHAMVVAHGRRLGLFCAVGAAALLIAWTGIMAGHVRVQDLVGPTLILALAVAWGDATRARREHIRSLEDRARDVDARLEAEAARRVAEDRLRIARDLHDSVGHQVAVISLNAGVAKLALPDRPEAAAGALEVIGTATTGVLKQINELLVELREAPSGSGPGLERLQDLLREFAELGLTVDAHIDPPGSRVSATVDAVAYRVIQEGLTNAHKHGANAHAALDLHVGERLSIRIANATGTRRHRGAGHGLGLVGLRERVAAVGGTARAESDGSTFTLSVTLPLLTQEIS